MRSTRSEGCAGAFLCKNLSLSNVTHSGKSVSFQTFPLIVTEATGWFAIKTRGICSDVDDCCCGQRGKIVVVLAELMCCDFSAMLWAVDAIVFNAFVAAAETFERSTSYTGGSGRLDSRTNY